MRTFRHEDKYAWEPLKHYLVTYVSEMVKVVYNKAMT